MLYKGKLLLLFLFLVTTIIFWDNIFLYPIKIFVVYLHEISHAITAIITGGEVHKIYTYINENGATLTRGGNIILIAISGYIGSILWGAMMLHSSLSNRFIYVVCIAIGLIIPIFTHLYYYQKYTFLYWFLFTFGLSFLFLPLISKYITRVILFFLGSISCIYSIYDLNDFLSNSIMLTDAGIIAKIYSNDSSQQEIIAYSIAAMISCCSIFILLFILKRGLKTKDKSLNKKEIDQIEEEKSLQQKEELEKNTWKDFQKWKEYKNSHGKYNDKS